MRNGGIDAAVNDYLERLDTERGLSGHTVDAYRRDLSQFTTMCHRLGVERLDGVERRTVRRFLSQLTTLHYSRRSVARKASAVRAFLEDAVRRGEIPVMGTGNGGIANSLASKVANADAAYGDGRVNAVVNLLEALRNQLDAQRAKHVSEAAYLTLDSAAEQLIAVL